jgi:hypothetical protein
MKKAITFILAAALALSLAACGGGGTPTTNGGNSTPTPTSAEPTPAPTPEPTPTPTPTPEPTPTEDADVSSSGRAGSLWEKSYFVDEFKQPTEEAYVYNNTLVVGTFSNSATTNSMVTATILIDAENMAIMLYEYGRSAVKNSSTRYDEAYDIKMKTADGTTIDMAGAIWTGGDRIVIDETYRSDIIEALSALPVGDVAFVSFYIVRSDSPTTTYLLPVPMSNFGDVIDTLSE